MIYNEHIHNSLDMPIIDRLIYADDWAKGYCKSQVVVTFSGVSDINAIKLYDAYGNLVVPEPAPPTLDPITRLELALAELADIVTGGE